MGIHSFREQLLRHETSTDIKFQPYIGIESAREEFQKWFYNFMHPEQPVLGTINSGENKIILDKPNPETNVVLDHIDVQVEYLENLLKNLQSISGNQQEIAVTSQTDVEHLDGIADMGNAFVSREGAEIYELLRGRIKIWFKQDEKGFRTIAARLCDEDRLFVQKLLNE